MEAIFFIALALLALYESRQKTESTGAGGLADYEIENNIWAEIETEGVETEGTETE